MMFTPPWSPPTPLCSGSPWCITCASAAMAQSMWSTMAMVTLNPMVLRLNILMKSDFMFIKYIDTNMVSTNTIGFRVTLVYHKGFCSHGFSFFYQKHTSGGHCLAKEPQPTAQRYMWTTISPYMFLSRINFFKKIKCLYIAAGAIRSKPCWYSSVGFHTLSVGLKRGENRIVNGIHFGHILDTSFLMEKMNKCVQSNYVSKLLDTLWTHFGHIIF